MRESTTTRPAGGYTLVEMVAALAIVSILMLGVGSAMLVASRAVDPGTRPRVTHTAAEAAARVAGDIEFAVAFTERAAHAVTFTVADRDGDGSEETIRYAWSGAAGDPLTRQVNGGTAVTVLDDVRECDLSYNLKSLTEEPDAQRSESGEILLASHQTPEEGENFTVTGSRWIGQYVAPSLPGNAVSWRVTRVLLVARRDGYANDVMGVQLRLPNASNLPSRTVVEEVPVHEDRLTDGYLWHEFAFSNAGGLSPSKGICLTVVALSGDYDFCQIRYDGEQEDDEDEGGGGGLSGGMRRTNSGEGSWWPVAEQAMLFAVYGTVTTTSEPDPVTQTWVRGAGLRLRTGPDPQTAVETGVRILNAPEVTE